MSVLGKEIEATYEVLSKMGEGGMGAVYKVRHRFFDEIRVVKVMQTDLASSPELMERFVGEAKRGKSLRHPNIAEVMDFSITPDGLAYIVMEYIEGVNLRQLLARNNGPLDYKFVLPIAQQALSALGFLHSRRFVHRDISPDNLMLMKDGATEEPRVKLIDLGIAKSLESTRQLTMVGKFIGKVNYAAPEQFGGSVDARSDLYSFGVVLYEALTGVKPIAGADTMQVMAGHLSRPPRPFEETDPGNRVPLPVRLAVMKALAKDPEQRFQTAAEFSEALKIDAMLYEPTVVEQTMITAAAPERRRSRVPLVLGAIVLLLAAIGGYLAMRNGDVPAAVSTASTTPAPALTVTAPAPTPTPTPLPAVVENGNLFINALPWGEVVSVRDASGKEHLTARAETPLMLFVPAGAYKVTVTNPNSKRTITLDADVKANATARAVAQLDPIDARKYVEGL